MPTHPKSSQPDFEALFARVQDVVACPACFGELRVDHLRLICEKCAKVYPVVDGIPLLIAEEPEGKV